MTYQEAALFEAGHYETDPRLNLPEILGRNRGDFFNQKRLVMLQIEPSTVVYQPAEQPCGLSSIDYASGDTNFHDDFKQWTEATVPTEYTEGHFEGFLAGFPSIVDETSKSPIHCVHVWENNSSVLDITFAVPLRSLRALYLRSWQRTQIRIDMDEVAMGDSTSRFEIPTHRNRESGELFYRRATWDDLAAIFEQSDEADIQVIGVISDKDALAFSWLDEQARRTLLDAVE